MRKGSRSVSGSVRLHERGQPRVIAGWIVVVSDQPAGPVRAAGRRGGNGTELGVVDGKVQPATKWSVGVGRQPEEGVRSDAAKQDAQHSVRQPDLPGTVRCAAFGEVMEQGGHDQVVVGVTLVEQKRRNANRMALVMRRHVPKQLQLTWIQRRRGKMLRNARLAGGEGGYSLSEAMAG